MALKYGQMWYGLRLEVLAAFIVAVVFFGVTILRYVVLPIPFLTNRNYFSIDRGLAGVAMSYTAGVTSLLSFFAFLYAETETRVCI